MSTATAETSAAAARSIAGNSQYQRLRIMDHVIAANGATCDECETALGMSHQATSARLCELSKAGRVCDLGERRPTRSGRKAVVWYPVKP